MAKVIEDLIVIKLSRMIKDSDRGNIAVIEDEQRKLIEETIPKLVDEVLNDSSVIVEVAEVE